MNKIILTIILLAVLVLGGVILTKNLSSAKGKEISAALGFSSGRELHKSELAIEGMWCASCAVSAQYNLKAIDGVADAYVGFTEDLDGVGWVVYERGKVTEEQIVKAIEPYKTSIVTNRPYTE